MNLIAGIVLVAVLVFLLLVLAVEVCLGVWTYRDAKARGLEAGIWTAVVVLVPSFVGLLIYLLVGRRRVAGDPCWVYCPRCGSRTEAGHPYCSSCGVELAGENAPKAACGDSGRQVPVSRAPLVAAIVCAVLAFVLAMGTVVLGVAGFEAAPSGSEGVSVGVWQVESSAPTSWQFSAGYFSGSESRSVEVPGDDDPVLSVTSSVGEGKAELAILVDGEERESFALGTPETPETVDLAPYSEEGRITLQIRGEQARDVRVELDW